MENKTEKTKGALLDADVIVLESGTSIVGCMSWETPYVVFLTPKNGEVRWQSDNVNRWINTIKPQTFVHIKAFIYGPAKKQTIRRVTITDAKNER